MGRHHDGTWDTPLDEKRLSPAQAAKAHCPKCLAIPGKPCVAVGETLPDEVRGTPIGRLHPERSDGEIVRLYRWLKKNAPIFWATS